MLLFDSISIKKVLFYFYEIPKLMLPLPRLSVIDRGEKFEVLIQISDFDTVTENEEFKIEVKPPQGAAYAVHRRAPPAIDAIMTLV